MGGGLKSRKLKRTEGRTATDTAKLSKMQETRAKEVRFKSRELIGINGKGSDRTARWWPAVSRQRVNPMAPSPGRCPSPGSGLNSKPGTRRFPTRKIRRGWGVGGLGGWGVGGLGGWGVGGLGGWGWRVDGGGLGRKLFGESEAKSEWL